MRRVRLWVDEPSIGGSGDHAFLVIAEGRKSATLLYVPKLQALTVTLRRLAGAYDDGVVEGAAARRKLAATIRSVEAERKRHNKRYSGSVAKAALAQLKKEMTP